VAAAGRLRHDSDLLIDQLRAIDNRRLIGAPMTRLSPTLTSRVGRAVLDVLDLGEGDGKET